MVDTALRLGVTALLVAALGAVTPAAAVAAGSDDQAIRGRLLPVPAAGPGERLNVTASDVSALGVVTGTAEVTVVNPDGTQQSVTHHPQRWGQLLRSGWLRQALTLPPGATSGFATDIDDVGEAAGWVSIDGTNRATRWSVDGGEATLIGGAGSQVGAVGSLGPWGVSTAGPDLISGSAELVARDGRRTLLTGTPELDAGYRRTVASIAGNTAMIWVFSGAGRGTTAQPVLWHHGATVGLPVTSSFFLGSACVSPVRADGSVVASGYSFSGGTVTYRMIRHVGGAPGTDQILAEVIATQPDQATSGLTCSGDSVPDSVAPDGVIVGWHHPVAGPTRAAYWSAQNVRTDLPLQPGEQSSTAVAVASGGRMVIQSTSTDGSTGLSYWHNGVRTPLRLPAGHQVASVVELTEAGLLVANLRDASGLQRPAAWNLP